MRLRCNIHSGKCVALFQTYRCVKIIVFIQMCSKCEIQWHQNETMRWSLAINIIVIIRLSCWRSESIKYRIFSILAYEDKMLRPLTCSTSSTFRERKSWYHVSLGWPVLETSFFKSFHIIMKMCWCRVSFWTGLSRINFLKYDDKLQNYKPKAGRQQNRISIITIFIVFTFYTISQMRFRTFQSAYFNAHANIWNKHTLFNKRRRRKKRVFVCASIHIRLL